MQNYPFTHRISANLLGRAPDMTPCPPILCANGHPERNPASQAAPGLFHRPRCGHSFAPARLSPLFPAGDAIPTIDVMGNAPRIADPPPEEGQPFR